MTQFYRIAGLSVAMDTFGRTARQAQPYLAQPCADPDITICADWRALQHSQPHLSEEDCEYLVTGSSFYRQLLNHRGMMLHASAVVRKGQAYLFTAPCGTGKSTHTGLWLQAFSDAFILNDDKPALRLENGKFYAYGTPWSGKTEQNRNVRVPLAGICILSRGEENTIKPCTGHRALRGLLEQTVRPRDTVLTGKLLELLDELLTLVPVWEMACNREQAAARMAWETMSAEGEPI